ncbi:MAG: hypothetical protein ACT4PI_08555 [Actinomycetota bacterium]
MTTRRREVGLGYGWLLRGIFLVLATGGVVAGRVAGDGTGALVRDLGGIGVAVAAAVALSVSIRRRADGPGGFPPALDLVAPVFGLVGLVGAAAAVGGPYPLALARVVVGALFLGAVTDAMLLGHWYLVQPGLDRGPVRQLVVLVAVVWPFEVATLLWPTGMVQALDGTIDDGWDGLLGWTWAVSAVTTIGLVVFTWLALRERSYSAVMAATGLLYLAILTAFGTDLVARAVLA